LAAKPNPAHGLKLLSHGGVDFLFVALAKCNSNPAGIWSAHRRLVSGLHHISIPTKEGSARKSMGHIEALISHE
jgi:hypothetical protein